MDWTINELGSKLVGILFDFILDLINEALQPFLTYIFKFLTEPVNISVFADIWSIIVYVLSMTYGLLLLFVGFRFILSGESPEQRENAKLGLRNILIMIVLVQASFIFYEIIIEFATGLTGAVIDMIDYSFFRITLEDYSKFGFELILSVLYLIHLILVLIILIFRYICVSAGVIFFAIGIFFYFISFLNQYGRLIINGLCVLIFLPFFYALVFLTSSKIIELDTFRGFKTLIMIGAFDFVLISTALLLIFVIVKAALKVIAPTSKVIKAVKSVS